MCLAHQRKTRTFFFHTRNSDLNAFFYCFSGDFKVNAMNEEELRKSVRRQKFEKQGLSLATSQSGTNTGTGTSDDEDDASTPSGDNAERSLASTLGGSNENIPLQPSSSFLQAALDGPGSLSDRGDRSKLISFTEFRIFLLIKSFC